MCYVQWTKSSGLAYGRKTVHTCSQAQVRNKSLDLVLLSSLFTLCW